MSAKRDLARRRALRRITRPLGLARRLAFPLSWFLNEGVSRITKHAGRDALVVALALLRDRRERVAVRNAIDHDLGRVYVWAARKYADKVVAEVEREKEARCG
jgi:hypothetical protein